MPSCTEEIQASFDDTSQRILKASLEYQGASWIYYSCVVPVYPASLWWENIIKH